MTILKAHRYQFNCQTTAPLKLNDYSGSMLRGAFGHGLRSLACMTQMSNCNACLLQHQCAYAQIFETPVPKKTGLQQFSAIPKPFIIEPRMMGGQLILADELFQFNMVLIGDKAIALLPFIIEAWKQALQRGLGKQNVTAQLNTVYFQEAVQGKKHCVYQAGTSKLDRPIEAPKLSLEIKNSITCHFITPLSIQKKGQILMQDITAKDFLMALLRRYYLLDEFYGEHYQAPDFSVLAKQAESIQCVSDFTPYQWQRYSSRQKQAMVFKGIIGQLTLSGELAVFLPMLYLGQWLHVGNKTTFGMGHYKII